MKDIGNKAQKEISTAIKNRRWWLENFPLLLKINIIEVMAENGIKSSNLLLVKIHLTNVLEVHIICQTFF